MKILVKRFLTQLKMTAGKRVFTHRIYTQKDKPSSINQLRKKLCKNDVKIHQMNHQKMPNRVQKFTK